jgi:hypothetical protein
MIVAFVPDLMDRSKVAAGAPAPVQFVNLAELNEVAATARVVVIDLGRPGAVEAVGRIPDAVHTIGFASHVDRATMEAARAAGCSVVVTRNEFFEHVSVLLASAG